MFINLEFSKDAKKKVRSQKLPLKQQQFHLVIAPTQNMAAVPMVRKLQTVQISKVAILLIRKIVQHPTLDVAQIMLLQVIKY
jgi:hypothetical protein